jgi:hypothetical protein
MEDTNMETMDSMEFYKMVRENRLTMYSKPRRYYNRDGIQGSAIKFLFFVQAIIFFLMMISVKSATGQAAGDQQMLMADASQSGANIFNYTTIYNSGKVFLNWTARNESADCIYLVERSTDGRVYESVGIKEGIGTAVVLFYSWMDQEPPVGYAFYRVKKIAKDGTQYYSSTNAVINQGASDKSNFASDKKENSDKKQ